MDDQQLAAAPSATEATQAGADQTTDINVALSDEMYPNEVRGPNEGDDANVKDFVKDAEVPKTGEGEEGEGDDQPLSAPHSWDAEGREVWETLQPEAQREILKRETQRDSYIRQKAAEAQQATQSVERQAAEAVLQVHRAHADQLEALMAPLPPRPDHRLLQTGQEDHRALFYQQEAEYRSAVDQRQAVHQQAETARHQAAQIEQHHTALQRQQDEAVLSEKLGTEWTDPASRSNLLKKLEPIGAALGYSAELMAQANATDILALNTAADKFAKADKWDALQKSKMTDVRAAKTAPKMLQPGVAGSGSGGNVPASTAAILYPNDLPRR